MSSEQIVSVSGLTKSFGSIIAVDGVDWTIQEGETIGIIGPNGAGKSTFLNLVSGVLHPTDGRIQLKGTDITDMSPDKITRKGITKSYQITNVFPELTVFENLQVASQAKKTVFNVHSWLDSNEAINEQAESVLRDIGLTEKRDVTTSELAYGDQRKVEIGLTVATDPEVILLDEPTAGMTPSETQEILSLLQDLLDERTVIITEHDLQVINDLSDSITVFNQGEILAEGQPDEIMDDSEVRKVYLGSEFGA